MLDVGGKSGRVHLPRDRGDCGVIFPHLTGGKRKSHSGPVVLRLLPASCLLDFKSGINFGRFSVTLSTFDTVQNKED